MFVFLRSLTQFSYCSTSLSLLWIPLAQHPQQMASFHEFSSSKNPSIFIKKKNTNLSNLLPKKTPIVPPLHGKLWCSAFEIDSEGWKNWAALRSWSSWNGAEDGRCFYEMNRPVCSTEELLLPPFLLNSCSYSYSYCSILFMFIFIILISNPNPTIKQKTVLYQIVSMLHLLNPPLLGQVRSKFIQLLTWSDTLRGANGHRQGSWKSCFMLFMVHVEAWGNVRLHYSQRWKHEFKGGSSFAKKSTHRFWGSQSSLRFFKSPFHREVHLEKEYLAQEQNVAAY